MNFDVVLTVVMDFSGMSLIKLKKEEMEAQVSVGSPMSTRGGVLQTLTDVPLSPSLR